MLLCTSCWTKLAVWCCPRKKIIASVDVREPYYSLLVSGAKRLEVRRGHRTDKRFANWHEGGIVKFRPSARATEDTPCYEKDNGTLFRILGLRHYPDLSSFLTGEPNCLKLAVPFLPHPELRRLLDSMNSVSEESDANHDSKRCCVLPTDQELTRFLYSEIYSDRDIAEAGGVMVIELAPLV